MNPVLVILILILAVFLSIIAVFALEDRKYLTFPAWWWKFDEEAYERKGEPPENEEEAKRRNEKNGLHKLWLRQMAFWYCYYKNGSFPMDKNLIDLFEMAHELREEVLQERRLEILESRGAEKQLRRLSVFDEYQDHLFMAKMEIGNAVLAEATDRQSRRHLTKMAVEGKDKETRDGARATLHRLELFSTTRFVATQTDSGIGVANAKLTPSQIHEKQKAVALANKMTMERWLRNFDSTKKWLSIVLLQGMEKNNNLWMLDKRPTHYCFIDPNAIVFQTLEEFQVWKRKQDDLNEEKNFNARTGRKQNTQNADLTTGSGAMQKGLFSQRVALKQLTDPTKDHNRTDIFWGNDVPVEQLKEAAPPMETKKTSISAALTACPRNVIDVLADSTSKGRMVTFSNLPLPPQVFCAFEVTIQQVEYNKVLIRGIKKRLREQIATFFTAARLKGKLAKVRKNIAERDAAAANTNPLAQSAIQNRIAKAKGKAKAKPKAGKSGGMMGAFEGAHKDERPWSSSSGEATLMSGAIELGQTNLLCEEAPPAENLQDDPNADFVDLRVFRGEDESRAVLDRNFRTKPSCSCGPGGALDRSCLQHRGGRAGLRPPPAKTTLLEDDDSMQTSPPVSVKYGVNEVTNLQPLLDELERSYGAGVMENETRRMSAFEDLQSRLQALEEYDSTDREDSESNGKFLESETDSSDDDGSFSTRQNNGNKVLDYRQAWEQLHTIDEETDEDQDTLVEGSHFMSTSAASRTGSKEDAGGSGTARSGSSSKEGGSAKAPSAAGSDTKAKASAAAKSKLGKLFGAKKKSDGNDTPRSHKSGDSGGSSERGKKKLLAAFGAKKKGEGPARGADAVAKLFGLKRPAKEEEEEKKAPGAARMSDDNLGQAKKDVCPHCDLPPFVIGIAAKPLDHRSPPQLETKTPIEPKFQNKIATHLRNFSEDKMPGHFPISLGFGSDGLIHVQEGIGDRTKKYYKTKNGQLRQGDTLTVLVDRMKGNVFFFRNGKIVEMEQQVSDQAWADLLEPEAKMDGWDSHYEDGVQTKMRDLMLQQKEQQWKEMFYSELAEEALAKEQKKKEDAEAREEARMEAAVKRQTEEDEQRRLEMQNSKFVVFLKKSLGIKTKALDDGKAKSGVAPEEQEDEEPALDENANILASASPVSAKSEKMSASPSSATSAKIATTTEGQHARIDESTTRKTGNHRATSPTVDNFSRRKTNKLQDGAHKSDPQDQDDPELEDEEGGQTRGTSVNFEGVGFDPDEQVSLGSRESESRMMDEDGNMDASGTSSASPLGLSASLGVDEGSAQLEDPATAHARGQATGAPLDSSGSTEDDVKARRVTFGQQDSTDAIIPPSEPDAERPAASSEDPLEDSQTSDTLMRGFIRRASTLFVPLWRKKGGGYDDGDEEDDGEEEDKRTRIRRVFRRGVRKIANKLLFWRPKRGGDSDDSDSEEDDDEDADGQSRRGSGFFGRRIMRSSSSGSAGSSADDLAEGAEGSGGGSPTNKRLQRRKSTLENLMEKGWNIGLQTMEDLERDDDDGGEAGPVDPSSAEGGGTAGRKRPTNCLGRLKHVLRSLFLFIYRMIMIVVFAVRVLVLNREKDRDELRLLRNPAREKQRRLEQEEREREKEERLRKAEQGVFTEAELLVLDKQSLSRRRAQRDLDLTQELEENLHQALGRQTRHHIRLPSVMLLDVRDLAHYVVLGTEEAALRFDVNLGTSEFKIRKNADQLVTELRQQKEALEREKERLAQQKQNENNEEEDPDAPPIESSTSKESLPRVNQRDKDMSMSQAIDATPLYTSENLAPHHIEADTLYVCESADREARVLGASKRWEADLERRTQLAETLEVLFDESKKGDTTLHLKRADAVKDRLSDTNRMPFGQETLFGERGAFATRTKTARTLDAIAMFKTEVKQVVYREIKEIDAEHWQGIYHVKGLGRRTILRAKFLWEVLIYRHWYRLTQGKTEEEKVAEALKKDGPVELIGDVQANMAAKFYYYAQALDTIRIPRLSERILASAIVENHQFGEWIAKAKKREEDLFITTHKLDAMVVDQRRREGGTREALLVLDALLEESKARKDAFSVAFLLQQACYKNYFDSHLGVTPETRMMRDHVVRYFSHHAPYLLHQLVTRRDPVALEKWTHGKTFSHFFFGRLMPWTSMGFGLSTQESFLKIVLGLEQKDRDERRTRAWLRQSQSDAQMDDDPFQEFDARIASFTIARRQNCRFLTADVEKNAAERAHEWLETAQNSRGLQRAQDSKTSSGRDDPLVRRYEHTTATMTDDDQKAITFKRTMETYPLHRSQEDIRRCRINGCRCNCYEPMKVNDYHSTDAGHGHVNDFKYICANCGHLEVYHRQPPGQRLYHKPYPKPGPIDLLVIPGKQSKKFLKLPSMWRKVKDETGHRLYYNLKTQECQNERPSSGAMGLLSEHFFKSSKRPPSAERCNTCERWRSVTRVVVRKVETKKAVEKKAVEKKATAKKSRRGTGKKLL
ncbi:unnamed protein product [Amoebophrya sp. A120]|nr:unnamed protein product [Amoebophrya sp. A120]|eukprot:GSA120T00005552001.1